MVFTLLLTSLHHQAIIYLAGEQDMILHYSLSGTRE